MNKRNAFLTIVLIFTFIIIKTGKAQQAFEKSWDKVITFHAGYALGSNDWEYTHPLYTGFGIQTISETGSFKAKSAYNFGFEFSKGYFGINISTGIILAEIDVSKSQKQYKINPVFVVLEGILFPVSNSPDNIIPLLKIGLGGIKSSGELNNTALFISISGGLRKFITENLGISLLIKGLYITYDEIPMSDNVSGDIYIFPLVLEGGICYRF